MTRPSPALVAAVNAAAWLADRALTRLAPSPTREAREHHRDVRRLSDVVDTLIAENADLRAELVKARAEIDRAWGFDAEHIAEWERELVYGGEDQ